MTFQRSDSHLVRLNSSHLLASVHEWTSYIERTLIRSVVMEGFVSPINMHSQCMSLDLPCIEGILTKEMYLTYVCTIDVFQAALPHVSLSKWLQHPPHTHNMYTDTGLAVIGTLHTYVHCMQIGRTVGLCARVGFFCSWDTFRVLWHPVGCSDSN